MEAYRLLRATGGEAPGLDLVRYTQLSQTEAWAMVRRLSDLLSRGEYRPSPERPSSVPKDFSGRRPIQIAAIADHTVAKALHEAIKWRLDRQLSSGCHAYRPGRSPLTLLAAVEREIVELERLWIVTADVRKAYERVYNGLVLEDVHQAIAADGSLDQCEQLRLTSTTDRILRGAERRSERGIAQGNALANPAFNTHISRRHDQSLAERLQDIGQHRYSDDLTFTARSSTQAKHAIRESRNLLQEIGLEWKEGHQKANLADGANVTILGHTLNWDGHSVHFTMGPETWHSLEISLDECYGTRELNPNEAAASKAKGWLGDLGPCLREGTEGILRGILDRLHRRGLGDVTAEELNRAAEVAIRAWERIRNGFQRVGPNG